MSACSDLAKFNLAIDWLRIQFKPLEALDRKDMLEVLPYLFSEDTEERASAERAAAEILQPPDGHLIRLV